MAYRKPAKESVEYAVDDGWSREDAERGYAIFDFDNTGLFEIEKIDACYMMSNDDDTTDEDCAYEAARSGFCKIIPVDELPINFMRGGEDLKYFGWVDTPENRNRIKEFVEKR